MVLRFIRDGDVLGRKLKKTDRQLQKLRKELAAKQRRTHGTSRGNVPGLTDQVVADHAS